eukprot:3058315-Rhodomonas_salina.2
MACIRVGRHLADDVAADKLVEEGEEEEGEEDRRTKQHHRSLHPVAVPERDQHGCETATTRQRKSELALSSALTVGHAPG